MQSPTKPILIIGAGLSGLATARILTNYGIPNIVFEASGQDRSQGFSISLREWGFTAILSALGELPLSGLCKGVAPDRHVGGTGWIDQALRENSTGNLLVAPEPGKKQNIVRANRNALRAWLEDCGEVELDVRYGHRLKGLTGTIGSVEAEFENGSKHLGSLVVACDGVASTVRYRILPDISPEVVPVVVYHGEFRITKEEFDKTIKPLAGESNILAGVGDGFNTPITITNITKKHADLDWSYSRPISGDDDPLFRPNITAEEAKKIPQELLDEIASRGLAQPWSLYLNPKAIKEQRVFNWLSRCVSVSKEDTETGMNNGVVFVGDAWHAMPIFGGEGGNHALLDAVELSKAIVDRWHCPSDMVLEDAVRAYYETAFGRCHEAVRRSKQRFFQLHRPMAEWKELAERQAQKASTG